MPYCYGAVELNSGPACAAAALACPPSCVVHMYKLTQSPATHATQMPEALQTAEDCASSSAEAGAPAQPPAQLPPYRTAFPQHDGAAPERWQDVLAQAVLDAHVHPEQDKSVAFAAEQPAWQQGQAARQAVPLSAALQHQVTQQLQRAPESVVARQQEARGGPEEHQDNHQRSSEAAASVVASSEAAAEVAHGRGVGEPAAADAEAERRAERQAEAERRSRLQAAEAELKEAEDLVGWARGDADVTRIPRGIAMLDAMAARWGLGGHPLPVCVCVCVRARMHARGRLWVAASWGI